MTDPRPGARPDRDRNTDPARAGHSEAELEELLQAALTAQASQITEASLRPAQPPVLPDRPSLRGRTLAGPAWARHGRRPVLAAAASLLLLGTAGVALHLDTNTSKQTIAAPTPTRQAPAGPAAPPQPPIPGIHPPSAQPVTPGGQGFSFIAGGAHPKRLLVSFTPRSQPVPGTAATVTYPAIRISGGDGRLAEQITTAVHARTSLLIDRYRGRLVSHARTRAPLTQTITVRTHAQWRHTLSIVFNDHEVYGDTDPADTTTAVVLDTRTGRPIGPTGLFTDLAAVDSVMRKAALSAAPAGSLTGPRAATLTMRPGKDGTSRPLTWYPTIGGLRWTVDQKDQTIDNRLSVIVGWKTLAPWLRPDN